MIYDKMVFGKKIRSLRKQREITIQQLAHVLGITRSALGNIEHGRKGPSIEVLIQLADYFDISLDYLVGRSDEKIEDDHSIHDILESAGVLTPERSKEVQEEVKRMREE